MSGLAELARRLEACARVPGQVARDGAGVIDGLLAKQFATGTDPYGRPWEPTKAGNPPLVGKTKRLQGGTRAFADGKNIRLVSDPFYARFHQSGEGKGPQRMILPDAGTMPPAWHEALSKLFHERLAAAYKGAR